MDAEYLESIRPKPIPTPTVAPPKTPAVTAPPRLTAEEETLRDRWLRVTDMARRGRLDALTSFVQSHSGSDQPDWCGPLPQWMEAPTIRATPTLLHVATAADQVDLVRWMLNERRVDPTVTVSISEGVVSSGKTPYEVAPSRAMRNTYRRCMADHPDWWNWVEAARVPSALTEEQEVEQRSKGAERKNMLRNKMREREKEREAVLKAAAEAERLAKLEEAKERQASLLRSTHSGPQRLGGSGPRLPASSPVVAAVQGLTEEQMMRIDRERRARAAEARLRG